MSETASEIDADTELHGDGPDRWLTTPSPAWNIGDTANGGYVTSIVLRALASASPHPDPVSLTTHFLRPLQPDGGDATVDVDVIRSGRTTTVARGLLSHGGKQRVFVVATLGDLSSGGAAGDGVDPSLSLPPPDLPPPDDCVDRSRLEQGVALPILDRLDVRIRPEHAEPAGSDAAVIEGWIRLADGTAPTSVHLPLFADAFPPSLYPLLGRVGWVPTVELTVHVRRRPAPGWVRVRLECDDLADGRMIETGSLWDSTGALVARSRQLGLLRT